MHFYPPSNWPIRGDAAVLNVRSGRFGPHLQAFLAIQMVEGPVNERRLSSLVSYFEIKASLRSAISSKGAVDL